MTEIQAQLLRFLSHELFDASTAVTMTPAILEEAKAQTVSTLVDADYSVLAENIRVISAHEELSRILAGIPFVTFKGYASAYYYPQPVKRTMGDVDFITDACHYDEVVQRLIDAGWEKSSAIHERHEAFYKGKVELELHHEIKGIPNGADGIRTSSETAEDIVRSLLDDLITSARTVKTRQGQVVIPDDFHHGLIMLLHIAGHMINGGGVGLRHLCDWAVYVNRVNVERFRDKLESAGLWIFACQLTAVCIRYLGLPDKKWAGEWPEEFLTTLLEDFLTAGNFGRKVTGRTATMELENTSFVQLTKKRYPAAENRLLLPFFMIVYVLRYAVLILLGKRKIIKLSTFVGAKGRSELYKEFHLFEV